MSTSRTLDRVIRERAPLPVAMAWHRVLLALAPAERISAVGAFTDVLARTLNALVLPDYLRGPAVDDVEHRLQRLSRPALGVLAGLYRATCTALAARDEVFWRDPVLAGHGADAPATRALDVLVELRNRSAHDTLSVTQRTKLASDFTSAAREAMRAMPWLLRARLVRVVDERSTRDGARQGALQFFVGHVHAPEPVAATWSAPLARDAVYLVHPDGARLLDLDPFVGVAHVDGANAERLHLWKNMPDLVDVALVDDDAGHALRHRPVLHGAPLDWRAWLQRRAEHPARVLDEARAVEVLQAPAVEGSAADGTVFDDRFEVRGVLGEGGMATVYRCYDRARDETCALKVMHAHVTDGFEFRARFKREVKALRTLQHPHVVPLDDAFELDDGRLCLRMPVLPGGSLADRVRAGGASEERVRRWADEALQVLAFLHERGVVHRDIKPSNLLLDADDHVVVADFGVAWRDDDPRLTRASEVVGTTAYLAPELRRGGLAPSGAADIYALALVLHEALTGDERATVAGVGVGGALGALLRRMGADDPAARPDARACLALLRDGPDGPDGPMTPATDTGDTARNVTTTDITARGMAAGTTTDATSATDRAGTTATTGTTGTTGVAAVTALAGTIGPRRSWRLGVAALVGVTALVAGVFGGRSLRPRCGDGVVSAGEECDDGNDFDGDVCSSTCTAATAAFGAGAFWMGYRDEDLAAGMHLVTPSRRPPAYLLLRAQVSTPATPVLMAAGRIAKTEVSRAAFARFLADDTAGQLYGHQARTAESRARHRQLIDEVRQRHADGDLLREPPDPTLPVEVPFDEAVAFCAWAGGAIPAESAYEFAGRGQGLGRIFPWGDTPPRKSPDDCHLLTGHFTTSMDPPMTFDCSNRLPMPVGSKPDGCTPEGVCDLAGNVDEWVQPGPVRWVREQDPNAAEGVQRAVAHLPGPRGGDGSYDLAAACAHVAYEDPMGLMSGFVSDCYHPGSGVESPTRYPAKEALGVVRGGNFDDSLPLYYQTRGRYPYFAVEGTKGFRCIF